MTTFARDAEELEGALLPTAELVQDNDDCAKNCDNDSTLEEAQVVNVHRGDYYYFTTAEQDNSTSIGGERMPAAAMEAAPSIPYAPVIPEKPSNRSECDDAVIQKAEQRGVLLGKQEKEEVRRNVGEIQAIKWHQKNQVEEATRRARQIQGNEEAGFVQTTLTLEPPEPAATTILEQQRKEPEFFVGTYGKEYEVAEYNIGEEYETKEYQVSEYKSVYE